MYDFFYTAVLQFHERDVQVHCPAETRLNGILMSSRNKENEYKWVGIAVIINHSQHSDIFLLKINKQKNASVCKTALYTVLRQRS